jgi:hypothetical protein
MRKFTFTLMLEDVAKVTDKLEAKLFEAGCDDALLFSRDERVYLDFTREASVRSEAVASAVRDVVRAGFRAILVEEAESAV